MKALSLFSGVGGMDLGFQRAGIDTILQAENDPWCLAVLERHWPEVTRVDDVRKVDQAALQGRCGWEERHEVPPVLVTEPMAVDFQNATLGAMGTLDSEGQRRGNRGWGMLTSSTADSRVRTSAWPGNGPVYPASAAASGMSSDGSCPSCGHDGASLKMFPDCFPATGVPISVSYSGAWMTSGTVSRGEFWTRASSESPSVAVVSSLSAVLETRPVPRKYWLSARAAEGILRRAAKRGKTLPPRLMTALEGLASSYR